MNKLVAMRIADSKEGLDRISNAVNHAGNRRKDAARLATDLRNLYQVNTAIGSLEALVSQAKRLAGLAPDLQRQLNDRTMQAEAGLNELKTQLEQLQNRAAKLTLNSFNEEQLRDHEALTKEMVSTKRNDLDYVPRSKREDGGAKAPFELLAEISTIQPLWAEHIEAVAGLILRDDRFDAGLSKLGDCLVDLCRKTPFGLKKTLNVLGHDRAILKDLDWAVFLRFPAWTIWALPLIAHEFWHAASRELPRSKSLASRLREFGNWQETWNDPLMQDCLADAFGTYVIGPAYAMASLLLILDVNSPFDQRRAGAIFSTIDWLVENGAQSYDLAPDLKECWQDASPKPLADLAGVGPQAAPAPAAAAAVAPAMAPSLLLEPKMIGRWVIAVIDFLRDEMAYNEPIWNAAGDGLIDLLGMEQDEVSWADALTRFNWASGTDIRHVLHAGWVVRWQLADQDKVQIDRLGKRLEAACEAVDTLKTRLPGTQDAA